MTKHRCTYDDHDRCFECDKQRPTKAAMMGKMRSKRRDAGLVEFRAWVTEGQCMRLAEYLKFLRDTGAAD